MSTTSPGAETIALPDGGQIVVSLRKSAQARRLNLRVSGLDGRVTLTMPARMPKRDALAFLHEKADWLRAALERVPAQYRVTPGGKLMLAGRMVTITPETGRRSVGEAGDALLVPPDPSGTRTAARLRAYLQTRAHSALLPACTRYAAQINRPISAIALRDTRSRWGSCTAQGRLMFSWRLVMAPPEVLDYVAAHEVAHLRHMDHSRAFWDCVAGLQPDYARNRAWLRQHGSGLHSYDFSTSGAKA